MWFKKEKLLEMVGLGQLSTWSRFWLMVTSTKLHQRSMALWLHQLPYKVGSVSASGANLSPVQCLALAGTIICWLILFAYIVSPKLLSLLYSCVYLATSINNFLQRYQGSSKLVSTCNPVTSGEPSSQTVVSLCHVLSSRLPPTSSCQLSLPTSPIKATQLDSTVSSSLP